VAAQPPRQPFLRRDVHHDIAARHHLGDDVDEFQAADAVQSDARQLGIERVAHDETVVGVVKGKSIGGELDCFLQPGELGPRRGDVAPQQHRTAFGGVARLDLQHAVVGQGQIAGLEVAVAELLETRGDEGALAGGQRAGRDHPARQLQPDEMLIGLAEQVLQRRQTGEEIAQMRVGVDETGLAVEHGDGDAQRIERAEQPRGCVRLFADLLHLTDSQEFSPQKQAQCGAGGVADWLGSMGLAL
jgi:hypothetical protein